MKMMFYKSALAISLMVLCGCSVFKGSSFTTLSRDGAPRTDVDVSKIPNATPKAEKMTKAGNRSPYNVLGKTYYINFEPEGLVQEGYASWYGTKFHGNKTANGETYDMYAMTAAHKTLPLPSYVKVTNRENNRSVIVRVNDRGPFHQGRIIDLSYVAAKKLGMLQKGTAKVTLEVITPSGSAQSRTASNNTGKLYLQIGAFREKRSATDLLKKVAHSISYPSIVHHEQRQNLYKVLVGPVASEDVLPSLRKSLRQADIHSAHLVQL